MPPALAVAAKNLRTLPRNGSLRSDSSALVGNRASHWAPLNAPALVTAAMPRRECGLHAIRHESGSTPSRGGARDPTLPSALGRAWQRVLLSIRAIPRRAPRPLVPAANHSTRLLSCRAANCGGRNQNAAFEGCKSLLTALFDAKSPKCSSPLVLDSYIIYSNSMNRTIQRQREHRMLTFCHCIQRPWSFEAQARRSGARRPPRRAIFTKQRRQRPRIVFADHESAVTIRTNVRPGQCRRPAGRRTTPT